MDNTYMDRMLQSPGSSALSGHRQRLQAIRTALAKGLITMAALFYGIMVCFIIASLFQKTNAGEMMYALRRVETIEAFSITMGALVCSMLLSTLISIPTAYVLAYKQGRIYKLLDTAVCIPLMMPPSIAGLALLAAFGVNSPLGRLLSVLGVEIPFTFSAVVLVQVFVVSPFMIQFLKSGFRDIDSALLEAARVYGADDSVLLSRMCLPLSMESFLTGLVLGGMRAVGEFGATMIFAGNLSGRTQTFTTLIYTLFQQDVGKAVSSAALMMLVFFVPILLLQLRSQKAI